MIKINKFGNERTIYKPEDPVALIILVHGAGAGAEHDFIVQHAKMLAGKSFTVHAINFPYMQTVYETQNKRPPNRQSILLDHLKSEILIAKEQQLPVFLVGKSMGGRMSTLLTSGESYGLSGVAVLGYPFMPPGKPEKLSDRISHFPSLSVPTIILQGERDTFGNQETLNSIVNNQALEIPKVYWISDGDHSFKPRKKSGSTEIKNYQTSVSILETFIKECM